MNLICSYQNYLEQNIHLLHMTEEIVIVKEKRLQKLISLVDDIKIIRKTPFVSNIISILLAERKEMNFHIANTQQNHYLYL